MKVCQSCELLSNMEFGVSLSRCFRVLKAGLLKDWIF